MQKKHIITIAGRPGSGKSTTSKATAAALEYRHFSSGDLFRALGNERGFDVLQTNLEGEKGNTDVDHMVDQRLQDMGVNDDKLVIDSRLAWHWIPASFKVYLDLDLLTAAERILKTTDAVRLQAEHVPDDPQEYANALQQRLDSETRRYQKLYSANPHDKHNYDLVVDTKINNPEQVVAIILREFQNWLQA